MKLKSLLRFASFYCVIFGAFVCLAASTDTAPITSMQLMAWLVGGISSGRLAQLVEKQGIANALNNEQLRQLQSAGADANLIRILKAAKG